MSVFSIYPGGSIVPSQSLAYKANAWATSLGFYFATDPTVSSEVILSSVLKTIDYCLYNSLCEGHKYKLFTAFVNLMAFPNQSD